MQKFKIKKYTKNWERERERERERELFVCGKTENYAWNDWENNKFIARG